MTRPPSDVTSHLTDDDLGHLLRSTFAAAEPLASRSPFPPARPRSRRTPALVAATAVLALAVFGVSQAVALGYAVLYHASQFVPITLVGWLFLLREQVSLGEATRGA